MIIGEKLIGKDVGRKGLVGMCVIIPVFSWKAGRNHEDLSIDGAPPFIWSDLCICVKKLQLWPTCLGVPLRKM